MNPAPTARSTAGGHLSRPNGNCTSAVLKKILSDAILKKQGGMWPRQPVRPISRAARFTACLKNMASKSDATHRRLQCSVYFWPRVCHFMHTYYVYAKRAAGS